MGSGCTNTLDSGIPRTVARKARLRDRLRSMTSRTGPRILTTVAVATIVLSVIGFIVALVVNAFFLDEYDAYGEVPIPGSGSVELPAGDVTVAFHTVLIGGSGSGLPVPPLKYGITGPGGVDAQLSEDYGSTTTVNNDARVRIGYLHVPVGGTYDVELDGNVSAYLNPSLAFGHGSEYWYVVWVFVAVFGFAVVDLIAARIWASRVGRSERAGAMPPPGWYQPSPDFGAAATWTAGDHVASLPAQASYVPSGEGIRIEQLNTLARLRDSGALTEAEYTAEKKRVLDGL
jgi:hypothetical protein